MNNKFVRNIKQPRLAIDSSAVLPAGSGNSFSGIQRTALELSLEIYRQKDELPFDVVFFAQKLRPPLLDVYGIKKKTRYLRLPRWNSIECITRKIPIIETLTNCNLLHSLGNQAPSCQLNKTILTIHDAMFYSYPENHLHKSREKDIITEQSKKVRAVITCSKSSKNDIVRYMQVAEEKIHVIPWGYDRTVFYPDAELVAVRNRLKSLISIERPYFLSVSCDIGRKRSDVLLRKYLKLAETDPINDLVLVWKTPPDHIMTLLENHPLANRVHLIRMVGDKLLRDLYCGATVLFFPSAYEGFGLPVLESMACGTPVVTTRESSLGEVAGDAAFYVSSENDQDLIDTMTLFEDNKIDTGLLSQKGLKRAAQFSWEKCAEKTINLYRTILGV